MFVVSLVHLVVADAGVGKIVFKPSDGIVHQWSTTAIECLLEGNGSLAMQGDFTLTDLVPSVGLISVDNGVLPVVVLPPSGAKSYPKVGSTRVGCVWVDRTSGERVEGNLTVRILRESPLSVCLCAVYRFSLG